MTDRPIILDYIEKRSEKHSVCPFTYDYNEDVNLLFDGRSKIPFIGAPSSSDISYYTQTRVKREVDDEEHSLERILRINSTCFAELLTKTDACREHDDDMWPPMLELISKTFADRERDDEDGFADY